jgi:3-oxoacyl-[acyl-carrier protein] reductase
MNIVITGASNGIGYSTGLAMASRGEHAIVALSRDIEKLNQLRDAVKEKQLPGKIHPVRADLATAAGLEEAASEISKVFDRVDILINNAGLLVKKPFSELRREDWEAIYAVNVFGVSGLIRNLLPLLRTPGNRRHIVNISSMGGVQGSMKFKGLSAYSSSKAALISLTECLAEEFREDNIAVNCLALGSVATGMFAKAFDGIKAANSPEQIAEFITDFAFNGHQFFHGKVLPVSSTTP